MGILMLLVASGIHCETSKCTFGDYYYLRTRNLDASKFEGTPFLVTLKNKDQFLFTMCPEPDSALKLLCPKSKSDQLFAILLDGTTQECLDSWTRDDVHGWTRDEANLGVMSLYLAEGETHGPGIVSIELNSRDDIPLKATETLYANFMSPDVPGIRVQIGVKDGLDQNWQIETLRKLTLSGSVNMFFWIVLIGLLCNSRTKFWNGRISPLNLIMIYTICDRTNNSVLHVMDLFGWFANWVILVSTIAYLAEFTVLYCLFQNSSPLRTYKLLLPLFMTITIMEWLWDCFLTTIFLFVINTIVLIGLFSVRRLIKSESSKSEWTVGIGLAVQLPISLQPWFVPYKCSRFRLFYHDLNAVYTTNDFLLKYSLSNFAIILFCLARYAIMITRQLQQEKEYQKDLDCLAGWVEVKHLPGEVSESVPTAHSISDSVSTVRSTQ